MLKSFRYYDSEEMKIKIGFFARRKIENSFFTRTLSSIPWGMCLGKSWGLTILGGFTMDECVAFHFSIPNFLSIV
jgi:hypothetical protein